MAVTRTLAAFAAFAAMVASSAAAVAPSLMSALRGFYYGTGGNSSWIHTTGWATLETNAPSDPCAPSAPWFGIQCGGGDDNDDQYVVQLDVNK